MEIIDIAILVSVIITSLAGSLISWYWSKRKFKEYKEAKDAEENHWNNLDDEEVV